MNQKALCPETPEQCLCNLFPFIHWASSHSKTIFPSLTLPNHRALSYQTSTANCAEFCPLSDHDKVACHFKNVPKHRSTKSKLCLHPSIALLNESSSVSTHSAATVLSLPVSWPSGHSQCNCTNTWHISLNKYNYHVVKVCHTVDTLNGNMDPAFL